MQSIRKKSGIFEKSKIKFKFSSNLNKALGRHQDNDVG
jgi:hypothetical protein